MADNPITAQSNNETVPSEQNTPTPAETLPTDGGVLPEENVETALLERMEAGGEYTPAPIKQTKNAFDFVPNATKSPLNYANMVYTFWGTSLIDTIEGDKRLSRAIKDTMSFGYDLFDNPEKAQQDLKASIENIDTTAGQYLLSINQPVIDTATYTQNPVIMENINVQNNFVSRAIYNMLSTSLPLGRDMATIVAFGGTNIAAPAVVSGLSAAVNIYNTSKWSNSVVNPELFALSSGVANMAVGRYMSPYLNKTLTEAIQKSTSNIIPERIHGTIASMFGSSLEAVGSQVSVNSLEKTAAYVTNNDPNQISYWNLSTAGIVGFLAGYNGGYSYKSPEINNFIEKGTSERALVNANETILPDTPVLGMSIIDISPAESTVANKSYFKAKPFSAEIKGGIGKSVVEKLSQTIADADSTGIDSIAHMAAIKKITNQAIVDARTGAKYEIAGSLNTLSQKYGNDKISKLASDVLGYNSELAERGKGTYIDEFKVTPEEAARDEAYKDMDNSDFTEDDFNLNLTKAEGTEVTRDPEDAFHDGLTLTLFDAVISDKSLTESLGSIFTLNPHAAYNITKYFDAVVPKTKLTIREDLKQKANTEDFDIVNEVYAHSNNIKTIYKQSMNYAKAEKIVDTYFKNLRGFVPADSQNIDKMIPSRVEDLFSTLKINRQPRKYGMTNRMSDVAYTRILNHFAKLESKVAAHNEVIARSQAKSKDVFKKAGEQFISSSESILSDVYDSVKYSMAGSQFAKNASKTEISSQSFRNKIDALSGKLYNEINTAITEGKIEESSFDNARIILDWLNESRLSGNPVKPTQQKIVLDDIGIEADVMMPEGIKDVFPKIPDKDITFAMKLGNMFQSMDTLKTDLYGSKVDFDKYERVEQAISLSNADINYTGADWFPRYGNKKFQETLAFEKQQGKAETLQSDPDDYYVWHSAARKTGSRLSMLTNEGRVNRESAMQEIMNFMDDYKSTVTNGAVNNHLNNLVNMYYGMDVSSDGKYKTRKARDVAFSKNSELVNSPLAQNLKRYYEAKDSLNSKSWIDPEETPILSAINDAVLAPIDILGKMNIGIIRPIYSLFNNLQFLNVKNHLLFGTGTKGLSVAKSSLAEAYNYKEMWKGMKSELQKAYPNTFKAAESFDAKKELNNSPEIQLGLKEYQRKVLDLGMHSTVYESDINNNIFEGKYLDNKIKEAKEAGASTIGLQTRKLFNQINKTSDLLLLMQTVADQRSKAAGFIFGYKHFDNIQKQFAWEPNSFDKLLKKREQIYSKLDLDTLQSWQADEVMENIGKGNYVEARQLYAEYFAESATPSFRHSNKAVNLDKVEKLGGAIGKGATKFMGYSFKMAKNYMAPLNAIRRGDGQRLILPLLLSAGMTKLASSFESEADVKRTGRFFMRMGKRMSDNILTLGTDIALLMNDMFGENDMTYKEAKMGKDMPMGPAGFYVGNKFGFAENVFKGIIDSAQQGTVVIPGIRDFYALALDPEATIETHAEGYMEFLDFLKEKTTDIPDSIINTQREIMEELINSNAKKGEE